MKNSNIRTLALACALSLTALGLLGCNDSSSSSNPYAPPPTTTTPAAFLVTSLTPANNATKVATNSSIEITFNKPVDSNFLFFNSGVPGTLDDVTLSVANDSKHQEVAISVSLTGNTMIIKPMIDLAANTRYIVTIGMEVQSTTNENLAGDFTLSFSTAADPNAQSTVTLLTMVYPGGTPDFIVHAFDASWDTTSHGLPVTQPDGSILMIPPPTYIYYQSETLNTTPELPATIQSSDVTFLATLNNSEFISGQTYYFVVRACSSSTCAEWSNEVPKTMP